MTNKIMMGRSLDEYAVQLKMAEEVMGKLTNEYQP